jgi:putative endonuclease
MSSDHRNSAHDPGPVGATVRDRRGELGRRGEELACERLAAAGLRVVDRNWRCRSGEIDVVAAGPDLLVFCEVKTRRGHGYGTPAEAVTFAKRARLRQLAAAYLAVVEHPPCTVRFDVITVTWPRGGTPVVDHLEAAF